MSLDLFMIPYIDFADSSFGRTGWSPTLGKQFPESFNISMRCLVGTKADSWNSPDSLVSPYSKIREMPLPAQGDRTLNILL